LGTIPRNIVPVQHFGCRGGDPEPEVPNPLT
jgi:hypothetical protein